MNSMDYHDQHCALIGDLFIVHDELNTQSEKVYSR